MPADLDSRASWHDLRATGRGTWPNTPAPAEHPTDVLIAFVLCALGVVLFLALLTAGRAAMCAAYDDALRYCPGYTATTTQEPPR